MLDGIASSCSDYSEINALVAGVDEAGRGPLAGPVIAAAVILDPQKPLPGGLADSKRLTARQRQDCYEKIVQQALAWKIGRAEVSEIDQLNILQATLLAMQRAVLQLSPLPSQILVDGNCCPQLTIPVQAIIGGDAKIAAISAASIVAKVTRDREMQQLDLLYPQYGFLQHKGYPTVYHRQQLQRWGVTPHHRQSFAPVKNCLLLEKNSIGSTKE